jgi:hypothetical protein
VYVTAQLALEVLPETGVSVQAVWPNVPAFEGLCENVTVPVGVTTVSPVLVTTAVQAACSFTSNELGLHDALVVVDIGVLAQPISVEEAQWNSEEIPVMV